MRKHLSTLSIAAVLAASGLALHAPGALAADNAGSKSSAQSAETQRGVPGVDVDVGKNASDKGVPGVEMNVGKDGDQKNVKTDTHSLGASGDTKAADAKPMRKDRN